MDVITQKAADEVTLEQSVDQSRSVKRDDYSSGNAVFVFPAYGYNNFLRKSVVLPQDLPAYNRWSFYTYRDWVLLSTVHHEAMWAEAVATAVTKAAAWGWEIDGSVPLRRKRLQEILMYAGAGPLVGWVPFVSAHLRSYLLAGFSVVEIVRESNRYSSRITGINHLNPLRCRFTDNPRRPIEYLDRRGQVHTLDYWQVMMFVDQMDPTEGELSMMESAAARAYSRIATMEAVHRFLYEKVTGSRPLSIEFIQGVTADKLKDIALSSDNEQQRKGSVMFKGVVTVPIPGDIPIQRISIPISEVPDGFSYQEIHDNTAVDYAAAIGIDVNDLDPRIAQRGGLGTGAQAIVLDQKSRGKGLSAWRVDFTQQLHRLVAAVGTTFSWSEDNLDDDLKKAQLVQAHANARKVMQENGEIDQSESRNLAVDAGDLPPEMLLTADRTPGGSADNDDNPEAQPEQVAQQAEAQQPAQPPAQPEQTQAQPERPAQKESKAEREAMDRLAAQWAIAASVARPLVQKPEELLGVED